MRKFDERKVFVHVEISCELVVISWQLPVTHLYNLHTSITLNQQQTTNNESVGSYRSHTYIIFRLPSHLTINEQRTTNQLVVAG